MDAERSEAERRRREEKEEKLKLVWKQRTTSVRKEMNETPWGSISLAPATVNKKLQDQKSPV